MRPRVFPAEDGHLAPQISVDAHASMRPRVFPAEDLGELSYPRRVDLAGFNEAAGIPRGRLESGQ